MKRPAKEDVDLHYVWLRGVAARLSAAWYRHPLLVLRALRWFVQSEHRKGMRLDDEAWYWPMNAMKPLIGRIYRVWQAEYGCKCTAGCTCGRMPKDPSFRKTAQWIRDNPERA